MTNISIEYDGEFPNLCRGTLSVIIDGNRWKFPDYCLISRGNVWFDGDWQEHVESGPWAIEAWPDGFPEAQKEAVIEAVNCKIPFGCCGGCV